MLKNTIVDGSTARDLTVCIMHSAWEQIYYLLGTSAICMSTVCEFPNTLAITSWLVIKAIKVVHTARVVQCSTVANTGKLKLKSNLASVRHGEIYGNLIGSHVYWWQWPWHYLVAYFHIPNKHRPNSYSMRLKLTFIIEWWVFQPISKTVQAKSQ